MSNATAKTAAATSVPAAGRLVFKLSQPVAYNGETHSEISYRPATGRDMRKYLNGGRVGDRYTLLMVDLFELPEAFFDALPGADYWALTEVMDGFFKRTPSNVDDVIADILWGFPSMREERIEAMDAAELMAWHARAIKAKRRDAEMMQAAMTNAVATLLNAMR